MASHHDSLALGTIDHGQKQLEPRAKYTLLLSCECQVCCPGNEQLTNTPCLAPWNKRVMSVLNLHRSGMFKTSQYKLSTAFDSS